MAVGVTAVEESVVFKSQRQQQPAPAMSRPEPYAAVAVLPGVELPQAVLAAQAAELPVEPPAPAPVPAPAFVAEPVPEPVPEPEPAPAPPVLVAAYVAGPVVVAPPAPPGPPAAWYPDPSGTFAHRYWDGAAWTNHTAP